MVLAYSNSTTFKWIDQYYIAASNSDTLYEEGGCQFLFHPHFIDTDHELGLTQPTTDPLPISTATNDAFILTTWSDHKVITDSSLAPENGFAFEPSKKIPDRGASAVVYLTSFVEGTKRLTPCELFQSLYHTQGTKLLLTNYSLYEPLAVYRRVEQSTYSSETSRCLFLSEQQRNQEW